MVDIYTSLYYSLEGMSEGQGRGSWDGITESC